MIERTKNVMRYSFQKCYYYKSVTVSEVFLGQIVDKVRNQGENLRFLNEKVRLLSSPLVPIQLHNNLVAVALVISIVA